MTLETRKANKLARKIWGSVDDFCVANDLPIPETKTEDSSRRKRRGDRDEEDNGNASAKKAKDGDPDPAEAKANMSVADIRAMMSNTMRQIQERKKELNMIKGANGQEIDTSTAPVIPAVPAAIGPTKPALPSGGVMSDKAKTIADLQARIASSMDKVKLPTPSGPTALILDGEGRTVDASGQLIQLTQHVPTLKANVRAKKRDEMKEHLTEGPKATAAMAETKFFDSRMGERAAARPRRTFKFNEPGKYENEGNRLRMKAQLEKLQADISSVARRTGITSATQLAKLVPKDAEKGRIPDVEWWDAHIMVPDGVYERPQLRDGAITNLIEHPIQLKPLENTKPEEIPVYLTKKERKKLRRQNRREAWKEKQDKIRLGFVAPDEPKVKMSNLMRVLGTEAVQDPTKVEAHVRAQMSKRLAAHEKANAERKLTPEERKAKARRKLEEDTTYGVHVAIFRIKSLANPSKKFKVMTNANQLNLTGCVVFYEDVNVVVVEGGPKQLKKYKHLMLNRIKWDEETFSRKDGEELPNKCTLVWEGQTKERNFTELSNKQCPSESFARDFFKNHGVDHYWDLAYSSAVKDETEAD